MQNPTRSGPWTWRTGAFTLLVMGAALLLGAGRAWAQDSNPPPLPSEEQPQVLASGPVNEAFAAPINLEDHGGMIAPSAPPPAIEEVPSSDRPTGDQFAWVPGYWSWDTQRGTWIWVSACWRAVPPGMAWVPGYWDQVAEGYEWVPGLWAPASTQQIEYLPTPPLAVDIQASGQAPSSDYTWVPGVHYWMGGQYVPRRGYWLKQQHGWVWGPSYLSRTPSGYVFCPGHWDYSLDRRGVLFAPEYVPRQSYSRPGFRLEPSITISLLALAANLFISPNYSHYYVGDYYDQSYEQRGIYPQYQSATIRTSYDPLYVQARWLHHDNVPAWQQQQQQVYEQRRNNVDLRPARTYQQEQLRVARMPEPQRRTQAFAQPLAVVVQQPAKAIHFERTTPATQRVVAQQAVAVHNYGTDRQRWEEAARPAAAPLPTRTGPLPTVPPRVGPTAVTPHHVDPTPAPPSRNGRMPDAPPRAVTRTEAVKVTVPPPPLAARPAAKAPKAPAAERTPPAAKPPVDKGPLAVNPTRPGDGKTPPGHTR